MRCEAAGSGAALWLLFGFSSTIRHLGGVGLLVLGLLDSTIVPTFGGLDALTLVLAARHKELWVYYGLMSTIGSVLGASATYHVASLRGSRAVQKRFSAARLLIVERFLHRFGVFAISIPAFMPPPFPIAPVVICAGAIHYPIRKFIAALATGRAIRYLGLAYLASKFGRRWTASLWNHPRALQVVLLFVFGIVAIGSIQLIVKWIRGKKARKSVAGS